MNPSEAAGPSERPRLPSQVGFVVGLRAEAALIRAALPAAAIAISGATAPGAARAARELLESGMRHLLSFGFAAGLDPGLSPGTLLLPEQVVGERRWQTDPSLRLGLGAGLAGPLLHSETLVVRPADKASLFAATGCLALDMESGAVARAAEAAGCGFAVLRAVCDPASRALPPAARLPLRADGGLRPYAIAGSMLRHPLQLPTLLALGRDAARARRALAARLAAIRIDP